MVWKKGHFKNASISLLNINLNYIALLPLLSSSSCLQAEERVRSQVAGGHRIQIQQRTQAHIAASVKTQLVLCHDKASSSHRAAQRKRGGRSQNKTH